MAEYGTEYLDYKDRKHIRDVIMNRYLQWRRTRRDRYPFSPEIIPPEIEKKWGLKIAVSDTQSSSVTILIEIEVNHKKD